MHKVHRQLEPNCSHVILLECGRHVHVHLQESFKRSPLFRLLNLQLGEELNEPFETALIPIDPKEIDLMMRPRFVFVDMYF